jgi:threonyl-tRNA synthetase
VRFAVGYPLSASRPDCCPLTLNALRPLLPTERPRVPITITMPDQSTHEGTSYETLPIKLVAQVNKPLAEKAVIAKVDGVLWDLTRPLEQSCSLEILDFENEEAKAVFWHSSAHVLGEACEKNLQGCCLGHGPPIEAGFFYDMRLEGDE